MSRIQSSSTQKTVWLWYQVKHQLSPSSWQIPLVWRAHHKERWGKEEKTNMASCPQHLLNWVKKSKATWILKSKVLGKLLCLFFFPIFFPAHFFPWSGHSFFDCSPSIFWFSRNSCCLLLPIIDLLLRWGGLHSLSHQTTKKKEHLIQA